ncbi:MULTISPECIES: GNAT family N-acetyltransferase [Mesobacillus]|uniref:GNAT family N-acetyltransferase n=1 Tax=Mesobacillus selenatarsenatis TaxID=388741 RepID=A0A846T5N9_9BACI|nr:MULTISPECIES: GNAT family protein [Mesobacillus]NKE04178.1 GNAT family N-acetyltransferase [Mesobacillus selenatarsenatis]
MIELKHFTEEDIPQLISWIDTPEFLVQWSGTGFSFPLTDQQLIKYLKEANKEDSKVHAFKVIHLESSKVIGHISLGSINFHNRNARMCRVLIGDGDMKGKGLAPFIVNKLLNIAFEQFGLHKVSLAVYDFNTPALKLYQKMGFHTEGLIREASRIGDDYWNYYEMSILSREWRSLLNNIGRENLG